MGQRLLHGRQMLPMQRRQRLLRGRLAFRLRPLRRLRSGQPYPPVLAFGRLSGIAAAIPAAPATAGHLTTPPLAIAARSAAASPTSAAAAPAL